MRITKPRVLIVVLALLALVVFVGIRQRTDPSSTPVGPATTPPRPTFQTAPDLGSDQVPPASTPPRVVGPAPVLRNDVPAGSVTVVEQRPTATGTAIQLALPIPEWATEMQVGPDYSYAQGTWLPASTTATVNVTDTGYVMLLAQFRGRDGVASRPITGHVNIERAAIDATKGNENYATSRVEVLAPNVVALTLRTGLLRMNDGKVVGQGASIKPQAIASQLNVGIADSPARPPKAVTFTSRPVSGKAGGDHPEAVMEHTFHITLSAPLTPGASYTVTSRNKTVEPTTSQYRPDAAVSSAIRVNQAGFASGDPLKVAYLSTSTDHAIDYGTVERFTVRLATTNEVVFTGKPVKRPHDDEMNKGDLTRVDVWELDFSQVTFPNDYRICAEGVGCSTAVPISTNGRWMQITTAVARAMLHQRSGIAIGAPSTDIARPRAAHPDDGTVVNLSNITLEEGSNGLDLEAPDKFESLAANLTKATLPGAWGGHMDAGDWDRRVQHLGYLNSAIELVDLFPDVFARFETNIPESGNAIPDLIDEGLWDLDMYLRMQHDNGGIRGGVEFDRYPEGKETSWNNANKAFAYAPDPWSSFIYATSAAEAARAIEPFDSARAATYKTSSIRAMEWALANRTTGKFAEEESGFRLSAAASLYRLTGDDRWHREFLTDNPFVGENVGFLNCHSRHVCDAAFTYARSTNRTRNRLVLEHILSSYRDEADRMITEANSTAYGWTLDNRYVPLIWGLGPSTPKVTSLLRAHTLFGDDKYWQTALRSASFSLGANALGTSFITGIGQRNPLNPLIVDTVSGDIPVWAGTPLYGLHTVDEDDWFLKYYLRPFGTAPDAASQPFATSYYDIYNYPPMGEFTVIQNHAPSLYAYGVLAALAVRRNLK